MRRSRARVAAMVAGGVAGVVAAWAAAAASIASARLGLRWVRAGFHTARFGFRVVTLRAYRRCPDCFRVLRGEARVCRSCGARLRA